MSVIFGRKVLKARKEHSCWWCREPILVGDRYVRWAYKSDCIESIAAHIECRAVWDGIAYEKPDGTYLCGSGEHHRGCACLYGQCDCDLPTDGWLSPQGSMLHGSLASHADLAGLIFPRKKNYYQATEEAGYWKLYSFLQDKHSRWIGIEPATVKQRIYIREWCERWNATSKGPVSLPDFKGLS